MSGERDTVPIVGDVDTVMDVSVNRKGGSCTTTLKKGIRERLGDVGDHLTAAALGFGTGEAVVLLTGATGGAGTARVRVTRSGRNRFEVALDTGEDEEVDDLAAAFLMVKVDQFKKARLPLMPPVTGEEWRAEMRRRFRRSQGRAEETPGAG